MNVVVKDLTDQTRLVLIMTATRLVLLTTLTCCRRPRQFPTTANRYWTHSINIPHSTLVIIGSLIDVVLPTPALHLMWFLWVWAMENNSRRRERWSGWRVGMQREWGGRVENYRETERGGRDRERERKWVSWYTSQFPWQPEAFPTHSPLMRCVSLPPWPTRSRFLSLVSSQHLQLHNSAV